MKAMPAKPENLLTLGELLPVAQRHGFAVGAFSPRYPRMIPPILRAAEALKSPLIVQISEKDLKRCGVEVGPFAEAFYASLSELEVTVPVTLHLDHTETVALIEEAIAAGFTSVMIDASDEPLQENIAATRKVADYAHARGVSVEGELGTIGAYGFSETEASDRVSMTAPEEVEAFVAGAQVDALAVSVGTVHGVREGSTASIDIGRLRAIRERTSVPLVLHGGSGLAPEVMHRAITVPGGGVSKVNLATDLELAMLAALGSEARLVNPQIEALAERDLARAQTAVEAAVREKIGAFLLSAAQAHRYIAEATRK
jgi:fructose-bisphosphate aldolase class II